MVIHSHKDLTVWKRSIEISKMLPFGEKLYYNDVEQLLLEVIKMLKVMIKNLNPNLKAPEATEAFEARSY